MNLSIDQALRADSSSCIAFVGSGGKSTALFQLARQLSKANGSAPVILTATSHLGVWQLAEADRHIVGDSAKVLEDVKGHELHGVILVTGEIEGDRSKPIHTELLRWLYEFCRNHSIPLLIEADGSRQKPLKAWARHEPPIPDFVSTIVEVVGLVGLGKSLQDENVHRAALFSALSGIGPGDEITVEGLIKVLLHPEGGLKNVPMPARKIMLLNQADTDERQAAAHRMVQPLLSAFDSVVISSLTQERIYGVHERIAGILLAAGESTRYGRAKQLLDWRGEPFVHAVATTAREAGLSPVIVVSGANAPYVEAAVADLHVDIVRNDEWKSGQASSIRAGLSALMKIPVGGAIFLLADQPQITLPVLRALVEKHAEGLFPVIAPMVVDRRANPVLFDRTTFGDLLSLEGDVGGRAVFHKYRVEYVPWHDDRLLLDVDTPEMYERLISDDTL